MTTTETDPDTGAEVETTSTTLTPVEAGDIITVYGETTTLGDNATDTYVVTYSQGTASETGRVDTITNTMPQLVVNKQDMDGHQLPNAVFKLTGTDGKTALTGYDSITSTDVTSGNLLNGIYLSNGTYYLVETDAPDGYNMLTYKVKIIVDDENGAAGVIRAATDPESEIAFNDATSTDNLHYTFTVNNSSGTVLPNTGGTGTTLYTLAGTALVALGALALSLRKRGTMAS